MLHYFNSSWREIGVNSEKGPLMCCQRQFELLLNGPEVTTNTALVGSSYIFDLHSTLVQLPLVFGSTQAAFLLFIF